MSGGVARAQDAVRPSQESAGAADASVSTAPSGKGQWYGWQTILMDAPALALLVGGAATYPISGPQNDNPVLFGIGLGAYALGTPILHLVHDNRWGYYSFALRVAGPALSYGGLRIADRYVWSSRAGFGLGLGLMVIGIGSLVALPVLDAFRAYERPRSTLALVPWVDRDSRAVGLLLSGQL